ncbi:MAG: putative rane protein [Gaiellales bacterium]|jgi:putative membrane protein|nr:putative rane protein [Gaiellales bacterium]MDX6594467.1 putative rane protein [Gaiellales bacterium]
MRRDRPDWTRLLFSWIVNSVAVALAAWLLGGVTSSGLAASAFAGLVLGLVNAYIKPVLTLLGIPFIVITLGIGLFLINMAMVGLTAWIVPGFGVDGFWAAAKATIVIWLVNALLSGFWPEDDRQRQERFGATPV